MYLNIIPFLNIDHISLAFKQCLYQILVQVSLLRKLSNVFRHLRQDKSHILYFEHCSFHRTH